MGKLSKIKPQSKSEWLVIIVLAAMLVGTTVLLITKPFDKPEIEDVRLQAIEQSDRNKTQSTTLAETSVRESKESVERDKDKKEQKDKEEKVAENALIFNYRLKELNDLQGEMRNTHLLPLLRDIRKEVEATESTAEDYIEPMLGGDNIGIAENPLNEPAPQVSQETPVLPSTPENTQPVYTGPTSPPPLPQNVDPENPARETSPPPLPNVTEGEVGNRETSPPPLTQNPSTNSTPGVTSPPPLPQTPSNNNSPAPVSSPPPLSSPPPQSNDPNANTGTGGSNYKDSHNPAITPTVMPSAERIATVENSIVQKINAARAAQGLSSLSTNGTLSSISKQRAGELSVYYHAAPNVHFRPDGSNALTYIQNTWGAKYGGGECTAWIDNVQAKLSESYIFNAFFNSPSHHALIMHPQFKSVAVGIYCVPGPVPDNNTGSPNDSNLGRIFIAINFGY